MVKCKNPQLRNLNVPTWYEDNENPRTNWKKQKKDWIKIRGDEEGAKKNTWVLVQGLWMKIELSNLENLRALIFASEISKLGIV